MTRIRKYRKNILTFLAALVFLAACDVLPETGDSLPGEEAYAAPAETDPMPAYSGEGAALRYLRDGNTEPLVGLVFGDAFDYEKFTISGSTSEEVLYDRKDSEYDWPQFLFGGAGHRFSGLAAYVGDDFFGIRPFEDTLAAVKAVLEEPDIYEEEEDGEGFFAEYLFQTATLHVSIRPDGTIRYFIYRAVEGTYEVPSDAQARTNYETDLADSGGTVTAESIYQWGNPPFGGIPNNEELARETEYYPQWGEPYDEGEMTAFVAQYLRNRGVYRETPDGVSYDEEGLPFVAYYSDRESGTLCLVVHLRNRNYIPPESETQEGTHTDIVYCLTLILDESKRVGSILYDSDSTQGVTRERLYDAWGKHMASVSWREVSGIPFPFLTEWWNLNTGYRLISTGLCREYKTWFYEETAEFNETGRLISSGGRVSSEDDRAYFAYPAKYFYDADGRLEAIQEAAREPAEGGGAYSGRIELSRDADARLRSVEYSRNPHTYGTQDSGGTIFYDTQGRMLYNSHYITHGRHINIFLYEGDAVRPWACLYWCSHTNGFDCVYLFRQI